APPPLLSFPTRRSSDLEIDVETFVQQVVLPDCPPPFFALAHSMGGAVMLRVAHAGKRWFDRMVLSAPMIDLPGHRTSFPARALRSEEHTSELQSLAYLV